MGIGLASMLAPMYIAEIAPPSKRGALVTYQQIAIVSGITLVYFVNWVISLAGDGDEAWEHDVGWRYMLACVRDSRRSVRAAAVLRSGDAARPDAQGQERKGARSAEQARDRDEAKIVLKEIDDSLKESAQTVRLRRARIVRRHHAVVVPAVRRHQRGALLRPADVQKHGLRSERLAAADGDHGSSSWWYSHWSRPPQSTSGAASRC
jgi:hypothetical protein